MARCVQALGALYTAKITTGTEPADVLNGLYFAVDGQSSTSKDWRIFVNSSNGFVVQENTGSDASPTWVSRLELPLGGGLVSAHAASHQHGGSDEIATATPGANAIVKANGSGLLATGWLTGVIRNAEISASAAIAYSKLALTGSIVNGDISGSAAIAYSKLNLATSIVNADISASAAIVYSKLNLASSIVNADISGSAAIAYSKLNLAASIVNADIGAAAAIVYSKLNLAGSILNADINASAAITLSKLATVTGSRALESSAGGVIQASSVTSTELGYLSGVTSGIQAQINAISGGGMALLQTYSPSAASSVDIGSTIITATYDRYLIVYHLTVSTDDTEINIRTSTNNGSSVDSGASDYSFAAQGLHTGSTISDSSSGATLIPLQDRAANAGVGNAASEFVTGVVWLLFKGDGSRWPSFHFYSTWINAAGLTSMSKGGGHRRSATAIDFVRILPAAGTFTGTVRIYGLSNS